MAFISDIPPGSGEHSRPVRGNRLIQLDAVIGAARTCRQEVTLGRCDSYLRIIPLPLTASRITSRAWPNSRCLTCSDEDTGSIESSHS